MVSLTKRAHAIQLSVPVCLVVVFLSACSQLPLGAPTQSQSAPTQLAHRNVVASHLFSMEYSSPSFNNWTLAAPVLDYEELDEAGGHTEQLDAKTIQGYGIHTSKYSNLTYLSSGPMYEDIKGDETNFWHYTLGTYCGSSSLQRVIHNSTYYMPNIRKQPVIDTYNNNIVKIAVSYKESAVFYDGTANFNGDNHYPCNPATGIDWLRSDYANLVVGPFLDSQVANQIPVIANGNGDIDTAPQASLTFREMIGHSIIGIRIETTSNVYHDNAWQSFEDDEILAEQPQQGWKVGWMYGQGENGSDSQSIKDRLYVLASVMMTYNGNSGLWPIFNTNSGFKVMPEVQLVPANPVVAEPVPGGGGTGNPVSSLLQTGGGYAREFNHCYYGGTDKGPCAVFVTLSTGASWPTSFTHTYAHTLVLTGSDLADPYSVGFTGPAPPAITPVPADTAIVAFQ
jgi:hypothetical protein